MISFRARAERGGILSTPEELRRLQQLLHSFPTSEDHDRLRLQVRHVECTAGTGGFLAAWQVCSTVHCIMAN